jgi:hypothetical protein
MTQFRSQRERAAYALGFADAQREAAKSPAKPLSRAAVAAMSVDEHIERMADIDAWLTAGQPEPDGDDDD